MKTLGKGRKKVHGNTSKDKQGKGEIKKLRKRRKTFMKTLRQTRKKRKTLKKRRKNVYGNTKGNKEKRT